MREKKSKNESVGQVEVKSKKEDKKNKGSFMGEMLVNAVGRKEHKSKEVVNGEEKKGCDGKEVQKEKKKRYKSKEEENNYVTSKEESISVDVEGKEKKKKKKRNKVDGNDGVHGKKSHKDKESLGLSKDERESDHDVELEVKKDKKRKKKEKRDKSKDGREEILNDEEKENNLVTESNKEEGNSSDKGYTLLEERKEKDKKKKKKKGGDIEPLMMNNSNNLSAKESNESVDVEVEEGNILDTEKKEKKKKKKKNFPREILENSSDIEKTPLCDNDPNSNEGPSGSVAKRKRKRSREKEALPGKNINKGETRRKKKTGSADGAENTETRKSSKRVKFSEKVEVFPLLDITNIEKENKEKCLVRGKRFSLEEDVIVKDAVFKFIKEHDLGDDGIEMVLRCKNYPETRNCWVEISTSMPWRTKESIYNRAHLLFESDGKYKWTPEDLETIKKHHAKNGPDWRPLADELGKYRIHVKDAWRRMCLPNMKKGRWSQDEYQQLFDLVNMDLRMKISEEKKSKHGMLRDNIAWGAISSKLSTRSFAACCRKWYEQLESRLVREDKWASSDDIRLLDALLTMDFSSLEEVDWDSLLDHRPGDLCRKRWCGMVNHLGEHGNKSFADQVEVLSKRYCGDVLEARAAYEERTPVD